MTSKSHEERIKQHKEGHRAARIVTQFGIRLKPRRYESHNPMSRDEASEMEFEKARRLRKKGWGVCSNHRVQSRGIQGGASNVCRGSGG